MVPLKKATLLAGLRVVLYRRFQMTGDGVSGCCGYSIEIFPQ